jgi:hypothetical protein
MNDKHTIADSVMEQIEKDAITPKPRWEFLLKNYSMWALGGFALLVGAVAISSALFVVRNTDWSVRRELNDGVMQHIIEITPVLWILVLGAFVLLAMYQMKHTERGYKYSLYIIVGNIAASVLLGVGMYVWGYGYIVDTYAGRYIPMYQGFEEKREVLWNQPESGLLAGVVLGTTTTGMYQIEDFSGKVWDVTTTNISDIDMVILDMVREVGLVGVRVGADTFEACMIRPWNIRGVHDGIRESMRAEVVYRSGSGKNMQLDAVERISPDGEVFMSTRIEQGMGMGRVSGRREIMNRMRELGYDERNIFDVRSINCEGGTSSEQQ